MNTPAGHLSLQVNGAHTVEVPFSFYREPRRLTLAVATSAVVNVLIATLFVVAGRHRLVAPVGALMPEEPSRIRGVVWISEPGRGGGGGGGGNRMKEPPRQVHLPGKDAVTVPVAKPPSLEATRVKSEPNPIAQLVIPAKELAAAQDALPGAVDAPPAPPTLSQGNGSGGGSRTGTGPGDGPGTGSGFGPGRDRGTGGLGYQVGNGVTTPVLLREVKPSYTSDAMRAKVQGSVLLECLVRPDGSVGDVRVIRSLDRAFGLDVEAMKAARQWRFRPGMRLGESVPVLITIQLDFTLR